VRRDKRWTFGWTPAGRVEQAITDRDGSSTRAHRAGRPRARPGRTGRVVLELDPGAPGGSVWSSTRTGPRGGRTGRAAGRVELEAITERAGSSRRTHQAGRPGGRVGLELDPDGSSRRTHRPGRPRARPGRTGRVVLELDRSGSSRRTHRPNGRAGRAGDHRPGRVLDPGAPGGSFWSSTGPGPRGRRTGRTAGRVGLELDRSGSSRRTHRPGRPRARPGRTGRVVLELDRSGSSRRTHRPNGRAGRARGDHRTGRVLEEDAPDGAAGRPGRSGARPGRVLEEDAPAGRPGGRAGRSGARPVRVLEEDAPAGRPGGSSRRSPTGPGPRPGRTRRAGHRSGRASEAGQAVDIRMDMRRAARWTWCPAPSGSMAR
jgi:hypothetical protein